MSQGDVFPDDGQNTPPKKPRGRNGGRKPLDPDRWPLVPITIQVFSDQSKRLKDEGNQGWLIRMALDDLFSAIDKADKS